MALGAVSCSGHQAIILLLEDAATRKDIADGIPHDVAVANRRGQAAELDGESPEESSREQVSGNAVSILSATPLTSPVAGSIGEATATIGICQGAGDWRWIALSLVN
jgi:hypothetical protein